MLRFNSYSLQYFFIYVLIIVSSIILWSLASHHIEYSPIQLSLIILITATLISAFLFYPVKKAPETVLFSILSCSLLAISTFIIACINENSRQHIGLCLQSGYAMFFISFFALSLIRFINHFFYSPQTPLLILFFTLFMSVMPLWLSPWVESNFSSQLSLQLILWSSPLTYVASMLNYDYLHSQWFYQNSAYGMYRFDYPNTFYINLGLTIFALSMLFYSRNAKSC